MADTPAALQLRLLQTMVEVAAEKNSTLVLPFPVELLRFFEAAASGDARCTAHPRGPRRHGHVTSPATGRGPQVRATARRAGGRRRSGSRRRAGPPRCARSARRRPCPAGRVGERPGVLAVSGAPCRQGHRGARRPRVRGRGRHPRWRQGLEAAVLVAATRSTSTSRTTPASRSRSARRGPPRRTTAPRTRRRAPARARSSRHPGTQLVVLLAGRSPRSRAGAPAPRRGSDEAPVGPAAVAGPGGVGGAGCDAAYACAGVKRPP